MKKILFGAAMVVALVLGSAGVVNAQTPAKKEVKTEQTSAAKKSKADKKECKKDCQSKDSKKLAPATQSAKKDRKK